MTNLAGAGVVLLTFLGLAYRLIVRPIVRSTRALLAELSEHRELPEIVADHHTRLGRVERILGGLTRRIRNLEGRREA